MKSTEFTSGRAGAFKRLSGWPIFALWLALAFNCAAVDPVYENDAIVTYPGTEQYPPVVDALTFINTGTFTVDFTTTSLLDLALYETSDTLNYTNTWLLSANTGFQFDTQSTVTGFRTRAASFNNSGTVSCGSGISFISVGTLFFSLGFPQCIVNATNVLNPGEIDAGIDGKIKITGQNVDLTRGLLNIEGAGAFPSGTGIIGVNTNNLFAWDPSIFLGANFAVSAGFPIAPFELVLTNSTAYIDKAVGAGGTNIIRAVFIEDYSGPDVSYSVYYGTAGLGFGNGSVTIQWAGSYLDTASGNTYSNYLYLNDDYVLGASTNVVLVGGVPSNFTFTESGTPLPLNTAAPAGFLPVFLPGVVTNAYDFATMSLLAGVSTNSIPNGSVTNLPGRIEITGDNNLDLSFVQLTGQNYMSLYSTNQFNGSAGAYIQTPYADLNLGVTNGYLTLTNVMQANIPFWGGTVQAWSTRWIDAATSNDFRVLIVGSHLTTTIAAQVQNLVLHGSNNLVISDTLNVFGTFNANARSLTLTTNPPGNGSTSLDGELNLESPNIFWQSSVPNLRFLTNNGAIRMQNLAYFANPLLTNVMLPVPASGTLMEKGTNVVKKDKVTVGASSYTFVSTLTNSVANQVAIVPTSFDASMSNLVAAINGASGAGVAYSTATKANSMVWAGPLMSHAFTVTARTNGTGGNSIVTTFTPASASSNLTWQGHSKLFGGQGVTTNIVSYLGGTAFINDGIFSDQGSIFYAGNFESSGVFSNGIGSFTLRSLTTTLTNGAVYAGGDVSITADSLVTSNMTLNAARSLTLTVTNLLTDTGPSPTNNNVWTIGSTSVGSGFNLPVKPLVGDLLGTMVTLSAPTNRNVISLWAGSDRGLSGAGYTNNEAIGVLTLDVTTPAPGLQNNGVLTFNGASTSNAMYVDLLVLTNYAKQGNATNSFNFPWLKINTNMIIYFAQATKNGLSVAEDIDMASKNGANGGRLRWIYSYAGYYSSTNLVFTNLDASTVTNAYNTALVQSSTIDSDSDGTPNSLDPTPFFLPSQVNLTLAVTNLPPQSVRVQWTTIPNATNFIYYATNMPTTNWMAFTNFKNWYYGNNIARTNSTHGNSFVSPQTYVNNASLPDNSQRTNVWIYDAITNTSHYYKVIVWPWLTFPE